MKKVLSALLLLMLSMTMYAQQNVTKFLGIPVDGSKAAMIQKLKAKGFKYDILTGLLEGTFNGEKVYIAIRTNKDKVWRIAVIDKTARDEGQIKIRFNTLCQQFKNNLKYLASDETQELSDEEDISYNMTVNQKQYEANYYQQPLEGAENRLVWFTILKDIGKYHIIIFYENAINMSHGEDL